MTLKERLAAREALIGTFLKTPSPMLCEVLGRSDLDVVCIDAEHSPFDRRDVDACVHALLHAGKPGLVRVPSPAAEHVLNALDCGADGVVIPHVVTPGDAEAAVAAARYGLGRGYAGSTRAAGYMARNMAEHKARSATRTVVVAQIEDAAALQHLDALFAVPGIDAFFIGRADLTVSLGFDNPAERAVVAAVEAICRKGAEAGRTIGMFTSDLGELPRWLELGARLFLLGSDHGFVLSGAAELTGKVRRAFTGLQALR
jgi:2-keto-3-deoxy-L-rhamnonate aldolase RhmA